jgi:hypothetical protein
MIYEPAPDPLDRRDQLLPTLLVECPLGIADDTSGRDPLPSKPPVRG